VRSRAELDRLDADLAGELAPPAEFAAAWAETQAVRLWDKWRTDAGLLRRSEETLYEWYRGLVRRATALQLVPAIDARWRQDVTALTTDGSRPPFQSDDPIPGSPRVPVRGGAVLTYLPAFEFDRIALARQDWDGERGRLLDLRGLADALGMTAGPASPPAVLDLPEPTDDAVASKTLPGDRLHALHTAYPSPSGDYRQWAVSRFPDPIRKELRDRLDRVFDTGARHAKRLILDRLKPSPVERTNWLPVTSWLETDPAMKQWGQFLAILRRLAGDPGGDPVAELVEFLRKPDFEAEVRAIELTVPDDLRGQRAVPTGPFEIVVRASPPDAVETRYRFRLEGDPRRDGPTSVARFVPEGHTGKMTLRSDDLVSATVTLKAGGREFRLDWINGRSREFTFDRLRSQPDAKQADGSGPGERATGVKLVLLPENGWPAIPALLP
jgi:hypothetical protein